MHETLRKVTQLFLQENPKGLVAILLVITLMAITQLLSIGLVMPFVSLVFYPDVISSSPTLTSAYNTLGFTNTAQFTVFCGLLVLASLILGNSFIALATWLLSRFTWQSQANLSIKLLSTYLQYPYERFTSLNSADILKNIAFESAQVTTGVLMPLLNAVAFGLSSSAIIVLLLWIQPLATIAVATTLISSYAVAFLVTHRRLEKNGTIRVAANAKRYKTINEAFGSIKEVKTLQLESHWTERFSEHATQFASANINYTVLAQTPRFAVEATAFGLFVAGLIFLVLEEKNAVSALPIASAFAIGSARLLPSLQRVFQSLGNVRYNSEILDHIYRVVTEAHPSHQLPNQTARSLPFKHSLSLKNVSFTYQGADQPALSNISITIPKPSLVAFVGQTGAGKSTLADLVLGLLSPTQGNIEVDNQALNASNLSAWRCNIGYVPQEIFLADTTIAENIAFGVHPSQIDQTKLEQAAKRAGIHQFIQMHLSAGYATEVGERGVKLSGGQRQRIGIARALYNDPDVLILDEATSALDGETEQLVHQAITQVTQSKTVILIAHRLETIKNCDTIYVLDQGEVTDQGSFNELMKRSETFMRIAQGHRN